MRGTIFFTSREKWKKERENQKTTQLYDMRGAIMFMLIMI